MVQILVGPDKKPFTMHKELLCNTAPYFRAAFEGHFIEGKQQLLELPSEDPGTFESFQLWAYTGSILKEGENTAGISWETLVGLYIFGDAHGISGLQNAVIDLMIDKNDVDKKIPIEEIRKIWGQFSEASPLRRLVLEMSACNGAVTLWFMRGDRSEFSKEFLFDLAMRLYELKQETEPPVKNFQTVRLDYHVSSSPTSSSSTQK